MDEEKLTKLYDTLSKLAPRGKVGGLGYNSFAKQGKRDPSLPNNAGTYHKRKFEDDEDNDTTKPATNDNDDESNEEKELSKEERKRLKREKKERREKKRLKKEKKRLKKEKIDKNDQSSDSESES